MTMIYALLCVVFALPYYLISSQCGLNMKTFFDAIYFSLETMVTIGYGTANNDPYFQGCGFGLPLIFIQSILGCLFDAVCMGLVYGRMSRVNQRASTIIFSDKAIIRFTNEGIPYFMFQVCEMRKHQLIEAHVRCYAFLRPLLNTSIDSGAKRVGGKRKFITKSMRLEHPDDELGGLVLLAAPQVIAHRIDHWSPLCPPSMTSASANGPHAFPSLIRRGIDQVLGREEPVFPPSEQKIVMEQKEQKSRIIRNANTTTAAEKKKWILEWMEQTRIEVLCLLEGIESVGSGTLQCRHSYAPEDILFDHEFDECVWDDSDGNTLGSATIDFDRFHKVIPVDSNDKPWSTCSHIA